MTREEIKQLKGIEPNCFETSREEEWYCEGLVQGLEITEKELIDKACEWFKNDVLYVNDDYFGDPKVMAVGYDKIEDFINDFRKAMEE